MHVLWELGRARVSQARAALPAKERPAYNTVLTVLRILEQKGYVRHELHGRAFVYFPVVAREWAQRTAVRRLIGQLFDGSPGSLAVNLLTHEELNRDELARIRSLLRERPDAGGGD